MIYLCQKDGDCHVRKEMNIMSKSYRYYPLVCQEKTTKADKKFFNKTLRHINDDVAYKNSQYKKLVINWNTWNYRWSWKEALKNYLSGEYPRLNSTYPTIKEFRNYYERCIIRK